MGSHVFRKYVRQQLLIVGLQVLHFFLLLRRLQLPQEVQSAFVNKNVASYSPPIREGYRLNRISTFYFNFDIVANSSFAIPFFFFLSKNPVCICQQKCHLLVHSFFSNSSRRWIKQNSHKRMQFLPKIYIVDFFVINIVVVKVKSFVFYHYRFHLDESFYEIL